MPTIIGPAVRRITHGPSKYDLMLALMDRTFHKPRPVVFTIGKGLKVMVHVTEISIEDGSGQSFNVKGQSADFSESFKIYYRTDKRTGTITRLTKDAAKAS